MAWTRGNLKRRIEFYRRNLRLQGLATAEELEAVAKQYKGRQTKDDLWHYYCELRSLARRNEWRNPDRPGGNLTLSELDAALEAMYGGGEFVQLPSIEQTVNVVPASYDRINLIEDLELTELRLRAARTELRKAIVRGDDISLPGYDVDICKECNRPRRPEGIDETLERLRKEITHYRGLIYTQVLAPGPAPVDDAEPVPWADQITALEHVAILQAYHRVNHDLLQRLPEPVSRDGKRNLPAHWSFLFAQLEARTKHRTKAATFMRDWSLPAIVAALTMESIENEEQRARAREESRLAARARETSG